MAKAQWVKAATVLLACALVGAQAAQAQGGTADSATSGGNAVQTRSTGLPPQTVPANDVIWRSRTAATQLAKSPWLDKIAASNPQIIAAICAHPGPAAIVARHPHLAAISDADPYLCRRLTRWYGATEALLRNPHADRVIEHDPAGIYWAMARRPAFARLVAGHVMFYQMVQENPDIARVVSRYTY